MLNIFLIHYGVTITLLICCKICCLYLLIFAWIVIRFIYYFLKDISNCNTFSIFSKYNPRIFTVSINSTIKNEFFIRFFNNFISPRSALQIFSIKDKYHVRFLNFLITGLCNSSANYWFDIFSFLNSSTRSHFIKTF